MKKLFAKSIIGLAIASVAIVAPSIAQSSIEASIKIKDEALKANIIGESISGYLEFVKVPTPAQVDINRAINEINAKRRAIYAENASKRGTTIDTAALAGAFMQISAEKTNGHYFKDANGWCIKTPKARVEKIVNPTDGDTYVIQCPSN